MAEVDSETEPSPAAVVTPRIGIVMALGIAGVFFLLDDVLGLINGGGIFSVWSALRAANSGVDAINVDDAGLRTLFVLSAGFVVCLAATAMKARYTDRLSGFVIVGSILAGGYLLDGFCDEAIVGHALAARGYIRCTAGDVSVGSGKGKVWFENYVRDPAHCTANHDRP